MSEPNGDKKWVTNADLEAKLTAFRWEVRFLIVLAFGATQGLPATDIVRSTFGFLRTYSAIGFFP